MPTALALAVRDLADRRILAVIGRALIATLLIFAGLAAMLAWALRGADPCGWLGDGGCPLGLGSGGAGGIALALLAGWLLFPAVATGVVAGYGDRIVAAVEARHYPAALASARPPGVIGMAGLALRSTARLLLLNLAALPFYLILLVTGIGPLILFVAVNGVAAGRDAGELVASRHGNRAARAAWLRATRGPRALVGVAVAALFLVPLVSLLAPVLGAAAATHLYHRGRASARAPTSR